MSTILILAGDEVMGQLARSPLARDGMTRVAARTVAEALAKAAQLKPRMIVVESAIPQAEAFVRQLRQPAETRSCSIVAVTRGETWEAEIGLLDAGANAVLRLPPGPDWESRIPALLGVPVRKETRIVAHMHLRGGPGAEKVKAHVVNISASGMLLQTEVAQEVGKSFRFTLELPGFETSDGEITGTARVVREAGSNCYGLEFLGLDSPGGELLRRYLMLR